MHNDGVSGQTPVSKGARRRNRHNTRVNTRVNTSVADVAAVHPPKQEVFDLVAGTNSDPKGVVRAVDEFAVRPWGLYMARPTPGRAQFDYLESWLLPALGLRANIFHFNPGYERDQDFYLDVGVYTPGPTVWYSQDHYLDLVVHSGVGVELTDIDELMAAIRHGLLPADDAERAVTHAVAAVDGLSRHGYDLHRWLSGNEMDLVWRGR